MIRIIRFELLFTLSIYYIFYLVTVKICISNITFTFTRENFIAYLKNQSHLINLNDINNINKKVIILIVINVKILIFISVKN